MPQIEFDSANKVQQSSDFPRLKLDVGERKRILAGLEIPTFAYVHNLRAPKIVDGKPQMVKRERKDKTTYDDFALDFIGRPQCLGDYGTIKDTGLDAKNCPMCAMARNGDHVDMPQRRFAMHVIVYSTKVNSFELSSGPFSCSLVVWGFTNSIYDKLTDYATEWGSLQQHDLLLGPCTHKDFQKFDIGIAKDAAWMGNEERKRTVLETYRENKATTPLESFCGRKSELRWIEEDLAKIRERWRIANGEAEPAVADGTETAETRSLSEGLDDLNSSLDTIQPGAEGPQKNGKTSESLDLGDLLNSGDSQPHTEKAGEQPAPKKSGADEVMDFESLLNDLS